MRMGMGMRDIQDDTYDREGRRKACESSSEVVGSKVQATDSKLDSTPEEKSHIQCRP